MLVTLKEGFSNDSIAVQPKILNRETAIGDCEARAIGCKNKLNGFTRSGPPKTNSTGEK